MNTTWQVGDGTMTQRNSPVQITNLTGAVAIAGEMGWGMALRQDGSVQAWGNNSQGQTGIGTNYATAFAVPGFNASAVTPQPTVSIATPSNNATVALGTSITLTASASETVAPSPASNTMSIPPSSAPAPPAVPTRLVGLLPPGARTSSPPSPPTARAIPRFIPLPSKLPSHTTATAWGLPTGGNCTISDTLAMPPPPIQTAMALPTSKNFSKAAIRPITIVRVQRRSRRR
ncbi:MAG: hypothetical protein WDN67_04950 [Candidatus Moraniibacteriota bacterium]